MLLSRIVQKSLQIKHNKALYSSGLSVKSEPVASFNNLEHLKTRQLIQVEGKDAPALLQGLITNDIYDMPKGKMGSLYAMFLSPKGRVLCDSIIYSMGEENSYIVESDVEVIENLFKHLKMYKIRKEVNIERLDSLKVYALYDPRDAMFKDEKGPVPQLLSCYKDALSSAAHGTMIKDLYLFCDPRTPALGYRILAHKIEVVHDELLVNKMNPPSDGLNYRWLRYNLGIGEGIIDIPPEKALPLEHNCDYMNGLNVHKGCYLGQELTARTFHTGKVRKRLMPLFLASELKSTPDEKDLHGARKLHLGKLRGVQLDAGLALLRMHLVVDLDIRVGDTLGITRIPHWWPGYKTAKLKNEIIEKNYF